MSSRVGLVGCGRWGANVLRDLLVLGATLCVAEPDRERRSAARTAGAGCVVAGLDDLPDCDGFVIVTPASVHREVCEQLFARGVPVFVEKPPCAALADVEELVQRAGANQLFVMHKWRYHPGVVALSELLARGDLGEPTTLETIRTGPETLPADVDAISHLGAHDLSIALSMFGDVAPLRFADGRIDGEGRVRQYRARLAHESGPEHWLSVAAGDHQRVRRIELIGTEGAAVLEHAEAPTIRVVRYGQTVAELPVVGPSPLIAELRSFLGYLEGGPPPLSSATDALLIARRGEDIRDRVLARA